MLTLDNTFTSADHHIGHYNIMRYCNRNFKTLQEQTETMKNNWNSVVKKTDTVIIVGDCVWGGDFSVFKEFNGSIIVVKGNHDKKADLQRAKSQGYIKDWHYQLGITIGSQHFWFQHFPPRSWNRSFHGSICCYGHTHNQIPDYGFSCDVGVDAWNFTPVSLRQIVEHLKPRDKNYNIIARDDYKAYHKKFEQHFTEKYLERIAEEENVLIKLLEN